MIFALLLAMPMFTARAQLFDPEHRSAIEVLAGISPIQTLLEKLPDELPDGGSYKNRLGFAGTVQYVFDLNDKWTVLGGVNLSRSIHEVTLPDTSGPTTEYGTPTLTFLFGTHYHWMRRDHLRLYSGVGVGMTNKVMLAVFFPSPIPTITPIGGAFGTDHFYVTAEITAGANSLGGLAGLGLRF